MCLLDIKIFDVLFSTLLPKLVIIFHMKTKSDKIPFEINFFAFHRLYELIKIKRKTKPGNTIVSSAISQNALSTIIYMVSKIFKVYIIDSGGRFKLLNGTNI